MPETNTMLSVLNVVAYIANIGLVMGVPSLFDLPDNAAMSAKYQTIVTPAGWAFAIWGLIFTAQAIWAALQLLLPSIRTNPLVTEGVGYNYILVCAVQVAWTFSFALEQMVMSMVWMVAILFFLFRIYRKQTKVLAEYHDEEFNRSFWLLRFPFTLHFGWIVAATLVNWNVVLVAHGAEASLQFTSAVLSLAMALVVGVVALYTQKDQKSPDVTIPLVLVWALNAISKELKVPREVIINTFSSQEIGVIQGCAEIDAFCLLVGTVALMACAFWKHSNRSTSEGTSLLN